MTSLLCSNTLGGTTTSTRWCKRLIRFTPTLWDTNNTIPLDGLILDINVKDYLYALVSVCCAVLELR